MVKCPTSNWSTVGLQSPRGPKPSTQGENPGLVSSSQKNKQTTKKLDSLVTVQKTQDTASANESETTVSSHHLFSADDPKLQLANNNNNSLQVFRKIRSQIDLVKQ